MKRRNFIKYGVMTAGVCAACMFAANRRINTGVSEYLNVCRFPFDNLEIGWDGEVFCCCPGMHNESIGNIKDKTLDEIWYGEELRKFREKILAGDYSSCKRNLCFFEPQETSDFLNKYKYGPKRIKLSYDYECNYRCITCRDNIKMNTDDLYDRVFLPKIINFVSNVEELCVSGAGDPLFSKHSRKLLSEVCKSDKNIKIELNTNGYYADEKTFKELGIVNNVKKIALTMNASTRDTYKKILRIDAFDRIIENLKYISTLQKKGKIQSLVLNFVIQKLNYEEMPDFVKLAEKFNAYVLFTEYQKWGTAELDNDYEEYAVFEPKHKDYQKFKEILKNPVFKNKRCIFHGELLKLALS